MEDQIKNSVRNIRRKYQTISMNIPDFIDNTSNKDYDAYNNYREIMNYICSFIRSSVIDQKAIDNILLNCNEHMDRIYLICGEGYKYLQFCNLIIDFVDGLLIDLVENELYEAASNLKKFSENFYRDEG
jgi:hypothetical protein